MQQTTTISPRAGQLVTTKHVDSLITNYKKERWVQNSERIGKEDSLSVWYSLEQLEMFLDKARENGADGVKLYFGVYDATNAVEPLYEGRQTIVMVATKEKATENGVSNKNIYINDAEENTILAFNIGRICPPFCGKDLDDVSITDELGLAIIDKGAGGIVIA